MRVRGGAISVSDWRTDLLCSPRSLQTGKHPPVSFGSALRPLQQTTTHRGLAGDGGRPLTQQKLPSQGSAARSRKWPCGRALCPEEALEEGPSCLLQLFWGGDGGRAGRRGAPVVPSRGLWPQRPTWPRHHVASSLHLFPLCSKDTLCSGPALIQGHLSSASFQPQRPFPSEFTF